MVLLNVVTLLVLKMLLNLAFMQKCLFDHNSRRKENFKVTLHLFLMISLRQLMVLCNSAY